MRPPRSVVVLGSAMLAGLLAYALHALLPIGNAATQTIFSGWVYQAIKAAGVAIIAVRVRRHAEHRAAFSLLAAGFLLNLAGDIAWAHVYSASASIPVPSLADVFYVASYVPFGIGVALLIARTRTRAVVSGLWLDGVVVALTTLVGMAYIELPPLLESWRESDLPGVITNASYPLGDALVVAALVASLALRNWQVDLRTLLLGACFAIFIATDTIYLVQVAEGTYTPAGILDCGWLVATTIAAGAAWTPAPKPRQWVSSRASALIPSIAGSAAVALLLFDDGRTAWLRFGVAAIALVIFWRFSLVSADNHRLIDRNLADALTDALTGLANRRRLLDDLSTPAAADRVLVLFDLDGFKLYNDTFGHPAGDSLLQMIGRDLAAAVGDHGVAYRLGGDEFCAVLDTPADPAAVGAQLAAAIAREGHGFRVGASFGATVIPAGVVDPSAPLTVADELLYVCKNQHRASADHQSADVLLAVVAERTPDLGEHVNVVAELAEAVARRLDMSETDVSRVRRAAHLHDIGTMAIPDSILSKPGPLSTEEWELMRQHTVIGQRILAAAPALRPVGEIVRASHERWDGRGYPDGLAGDAIPLGARIVFACDAYDAMTANRPYTRARPASAAVAELMACAGTQFDPAVVEALVAEVRERVEAAEPALV